MNYKTISIILTLAVIWCTVGVESSLESRIPKNFACNCLFNTYAHREMLLGLEYLDKSNAFAHDQVAMHGFSKLFKSYWEKQMENTNNIYKYIVKRGGEVIMLSAKKFKGLVKFDHNKVVTHETSLILNEFLKMERELNKNLLQLSNCVSETDETQRKQIISSCEKTYYEIERKTIDKKELQIDPMSANFLDENYLSQKVDRIKYLSDFVQRLSRFDHPVNASDPTNHHHLISGIGFFLLDKELLQ